MLDAVGDFEVDTRLEPLAEEGAFRGELSPDWEIWGPNGGYVAAMALRAVGLRAAIPRPVCMSGHFLRVADFGPVELRVEALRQGRRSESFRVSVTQHGKGVFEGLARTAAEGPGLDHRHAAAPEVPEPETLQTPRELRAPDDPGPPFPFWDNFEQRVVGSERFRGRAVSRPPVWREWYRFRPRARFDDPFVDAGRLLLLLDTLSWPAACQPHPEAPFTAPNLDVTAWFHALEPTSEWLLADHESPVAGGGLMGTVGRVWSRERRLLASGGAQLFCIPQRG